MDDITKCTNDECPMTDSCLRAKIESDFLELHTRYEFGKMVTKDEYGSPFETYTCESFLVNNQNQI